MHKKRDRLVFLYLHQSSQNLLLLPYVCYMAGESTAFGDPVELLAPPDPTIVGDQVIRLLRTCEAADIEAMKSRRMEQLRSYWRGAGYEEVEHGVAWKSLLSKHPALARGPGTYFRQYAVCQIIERDGWKYRKLVRVVQSQYRGCTQDGETKRIPLVTKTKDFGMQILEFLQN